MCACLASPGSSEQRPRPQEIRRRRVRHGRTRAEVGASFLCCDLGITPDLRQDHAAYIQSWLTVLKNDTRAIFTAASHAQKAADFLKSLQPQTKEPGERLAA